MLKLTKTFEGQATEEIGVFDSIPDVVSELLLRHHYIMELEIIAQGPTRWSIRYKAFTEYTYTMDEVSFREMADAKKEALGLRVYDTAIPQYFAEDFRTWMGEFPWGMVWGYGDNFEGPVAVTVTAQKNLDRYKEAKASVSI